MRNHALAAAGIGAAVTAAKARRRLKLHPAASTALLYAAPAGILAGLPRGRTRDAAAWTAQMLAYKNAFEIPDDDRARHRRRLHIDYPIAIDSVLGCGMPPGRRLQRRLRPRGHLSRLDKLLTFFYWSWEIEPHAVMAWLRWRHPERFDAAALRLAAVFDLTLAGYWAVPSAPPWWASEKEGRMDGDIHRVMDEVARWLKRKRNPTRGDHAVGANPWAAMPSDHFASAAMTALVLGEVDPALGACGWAYSLLLGFTLVYLGEHYVIDLAAGLALTAGVQAASVPLRRWWRRRGEAPARPPAPDATAPIPAEPAPSAPAPHV